MTNVGPTVNSCMGKMATCGSDWQGVTAAQLDP